MRRCAVAATTLALLAATSAPGLAQGQTGRALTVCLQANDPPLSMRGGARPGGFALALTQAVTERLGRELRVLWFVSRDDPDASLVREANALLSDHRCDLVAEYPLVADTLGPNHARLGRLPPFEGAAPDDRRRWVPLGELAATRPYRLDVLAVVLGERHAARPVRTLADLDGLVVGVELATLADAIAMRYDGGRLIERVTHLPDARELFGRLQRGELDAAFVALREYDAWRLAHATPGFSLSGFVHSVRFNVGFAALASEAQLLHSADAALVELQASGAVAALAGEAGLTYVPPGEPPVRPPVAPAELTGD